MDRSTLSASRLTSASLISLKFFIYWLHCTVCGIFVPWPGIEPGSTAVKWSEVAQLCLTLCDSMDCSLPGSTILGIFQARMLEWVAISFSRTSSQLRDWIHISCLAGRFFTTKPPGKLLSPRNFKRRDRIKTAWLHEQGCISRVSCLKNPLCWKPTAHQGKRESLISRSLQSWWKMILRVVWT